MEFFQRQNNSWGVAEIPQTFWISCGSERNNKVMCLSHAYVAVGAHIASLDELKIAPESHEPYSTSPGKTLSPELEFSVMSQSSIFSSFFHREIFSFLIPFQSILLCFLGLFHRDTSKGILQNGLFCSCISPRVYRVSWSYSLETWVHSDSLYRIINRHRDGKNPSHTRGEHKHQCDVHKLMKTGLCETHGSILINILTFPVPFLWLVTELWIEILVLLLLLYFMRTIPCP